MIQSNNSETRARAARIISDGGIIAFRTDTFYGLGVDPFNQQAIARLKELKGREAHKPILVIISDVSEIEKFYNGRTKLFDEISARYWPGALTIVARANAGVPNDLTAGTQTIGVRLPLDETVREFVRACGKALTATSANRAGESPARNAREVEAAFNDEVDLIIDDGAACTDKPSTVLALNAEGKKESGVLIREGVITRDELQKTFKEIGARLER